MGKWYSIEEVMMYLFGRIVKPMALDFEKAWDKEYYFEDETLVKLKKDFKQDKKNNPNALTMESRTIGQLATFKRTKGEVRKKEPASIKFIKDEI